MRQYKLIGLSILLISLGSISLKHGVNQIGEISLSGLWGMVPALVTNVYLMVGLLFFILSSLTWLLALSKTDLSKAYPMLAVAYALIPILSWLIFDDVMGPLRWIGIAVACVGVMLMARS